MSSSTTTTTPSTARGLFTVPSTIRSLFNTFPLLTLPPEPLPHRSPPTSRPRPTLHIFAFDHDPDRPSYNPACLKWQTFLRISGVDVDAVPSNNHASPSGALPFLLLTSGIQSLTGERIRTYARQHGSRDVSSIETVKLDAYQALLTQKIRPAWLHALYLTPSNLPLLSKLYLPTSPLLAYPIHHDLLSAASSEILRTTRRAIINPSHLYSDARAAFAALETLLGADDWFFGGSDPGIFDAEVFAYTWLILDSDLGWSSSGEDKEEEGSRVEDLHECLRRFDGLVRHRQRLYSRCWGKGGELS